MKGQGVVALAFLFILHSAIGYKTPQQKEDEKLQKSSIIFQFFVQSLDIGSINGV